VRAARLSGRRPPEVEPARRARPGRRARAPGGDRAGRDRRAGTSYQKRRVALGDISKKAEWLSQRA